MSEAISFVAAENPRLRLYSTLIICAGALFTGLTLPDGIELETYRYGAYTMIVTLAIAIGVEAIGGVRSLIRVDIVALCTLYFLTFAEFLHPHVRMLFEERTGGAVLSCQLVLTGMACIAIGRNLSFAQRDRQGPTRASLPELSPRAVVALFFVFFFLGYLYVLLVTSFNPFEILSQLLQPRFARPWQRGQEGGWLSFLTELNLLLYLNAAIGGYIIANSRIFRVPVRVAVVAMLVFILYFDFCEGARNVVMIKAGLFLIAFFTSSRRIRSRRIILFAVLGIASLWAISGYMLDFRNQGLGSFVADGGQAVDPSSDQGSFMIDNNLITIARIVQVFPSTYPFPGSEVVVQIFTKWVPRALWPGKPIAWTTSAEDALDLGGAYTLAMTYVGEAYLIAGYPSLIIVSLLIGIAASAWTRVGLQARSNLDLVYYASGFFAVALGMRSIQFITVAMVPTVALYLFGRFALPRGTSRHAMMSDVATAPVTDVRRHLPR